MNSEHYMEKLRSIREKYGCSHQNQTKFSHINTSSDQVNPHYSKKRLLQKSSDIFSYPNVENQISIAASSHYPLHPSTGFQQSRRKDKEICDTRENYAATRQKLLEDYTRDKRSYSREVMERDRNLQQNYIPTENYGRDRRTSYAMEEEASPIKRMKDFPENRTARLRENSLGLPSDSYWRQKQARLSELTENRLNEGGYGKISGNNSKTKLQTFFKGSPSRLEGKYRDVENMNKSEYTVSNIEKIQNRIQSILGNRQ